MTKDPPVHLGTPLDQEVIEREGEIEFGESASVDRAQEGKELLRTVTLVAVSNHLAFKYVQGREQVQATTATTVVGRSVRDPGMGAQDVLRSTEDLKRDVVVHAEHE